MGQEDPKKTVKDRPQTMVGELIDEPKAKKAAPKAVKKTAKKTTKTARRRRRRRRSCRSRRRWYASPS